MSAGYGVASPAGRAVIMTTAVKDVMATRVVAVREDAAYKDILTALRIYRISACPVIDAAGHVIGVVSEADLLPREVGPQPFSGPSRLLRASGRRGERTKAAALTAAELMSTPPITISPQASVIEAARQMHERGVKRLPVIDEAGRLVGIVSRIDVLSVFARLDSQIRDEVTHKVIAGKFNLDPEAFEVTVTSGIVTVTGQADSPTVAAELISAIRQVEGVIDIWDKIGYRSKSA
jgi:CBS domain-containing protein